MNILRTLVILSVVGSLVGCSSSSSKNADAGTTTGTGGPKMCAPATSTCTAAQTKTYEACVQTACDSLYTRCLGPNYKSGKFTGACAAFITCQNACACNDTACAFACVSAPAAAECLTCYGTETTCGDSCTEPACYSGGAGTGGTTGAGGAKGTGGVTGAGGAKGTGGVTGVGGSTAPGTGGAGGTGAGGSAATGTSCAALLACCNASTIAQIKESCTTAAAAAMNDDATCATALTSIKASICPTL